ncbi:MAG: Ig-like domain-containing protein [Acidobacteriota bacterium]|nr:Ig-like domain-containing protein [Acidobacteriota bacterium]
MRNRLLWSAVLCACPLMLLTSCSNDPSLTSIVITPTSISVQLAQCGTTQLSTNFVATGYYTHPNHAPITKDLTNAVTWTSLTPQMVTITNGGTATPTCLAYGSTEIEASAPGFHGIVTAFATINVTQYTNTTNITSLTISPTNPTINVAQTEAFSVVGTTGGGTQQNLTTNSLWTSSNPAIATINSTTGVATGLAAGTTAIMATYTNPDGTQATATTTLTVQ